MGHGIFAHAPNRLTHDRRAVSPPCSSPRSLTMLAVQMLARRAPDRHVRRASRRGARGVRRADPAGRAPEGRRLHRGAAALRTCRPLVDAVRAARADAGRRARAAGGADVERLPAPWHDVALIVGDRRRSAAYVGLPLLVVAHVRARSALRLQPHDARGCGSPTSPRASLVGAVLGLPLLLAVLWLMRARRRPVVALGVGAVDRLPVLVLVLYPTVIAPLFNKFSPLPAGDARARIEALLARCGFAARACSSWTARSARATATRIFTGFGRAQAHRVLRHAADRARAGRGRGGARARARPLSS